MTQKTAMQELYSQLANLYNDSEYNEQYKCGIIDAVAIVKSMFEKEKQQIIDAIKRGIEIPMNLYNEEQKQQDAIDYYNETYNQ
jgi:hypothetical protein